MPMCQAGGVAIRPRVTRRSPGDGNKQRGFRQSAMRAPATRLDDKALAPRGGFVVSRPPKPQNTRQIASEREPLHVDRPPMFGCTGIRHARPVLSRRSNAQNRLAFVGQG